MRKSMSSFFSCVAAAAAACLLGPLPAALGVTTSVTIGDNFFSPQNVTNSVGDSVQWTWQGIASHSSTGPGFPALWDSGIHANGFVFTQKFAKAGTFPYRCVVHSFQTGIIETHDVLSNAAPSVSIVSPTNGAVFAAPWSGTVSAAISANGSSITNLGLFAGSTLLGSVANPEANAALSVSNLPAGNYSLTAVVSDTLGTTNTSAAIAIQVVAPGPISLQGAVRPTATSFQFSYSTVPGLNYVVRRSSALPVWTPVATNTATGQVSTYLDANAAESADFYSVLLLPNP